MIYTTRQVRTPTAEACLRKNEQSIAIEPKTRQIAMKSHALLTWNPLTYYKHCSLNMTPMNVVRTRAFWPWRHEQHQTLEASNSHSNWLLFEHAAPKRRTRGCVLNMTPLKRHANLLSFNTKPKSVFKVNPFSTWYQNKHTYSYLSEYDTMQL